MCPVDPGDLVTWSDASRTYVSVCFCLQIGVAEDVHVVVPPGSYAVTAGQWGTRQQQTHVVHIQPGQTANLDFVM